MRKQQTRRTLHMTVPAATRALQQLALVVSSVGDSAMLTSVVLSTHCRVDSDVTAVAGGDNCGDDAGSDTSRLTTVLRDSPAITSTTHQTTCNTTSKSQYMWGWQDSRACMRRRERGPSYPQQR